MSAFINLRDHFETTIASDVCSMLLGDCMGYGTYRAVFEHAFDPELIVKVEPGARSFCNIYEHQVWERVKETRFSKWFAPVEHISPNGSVLVMRRTRAIRAEELPDRIPAFFTDIKPENWGLIDGRPVCHDYGNHLLIERGMTKATRVAQWDSFQ